MLKEVVEFLFQRGQASQKAELLPYPNNDERAFLVRPGEAPQELECPRQPPEVLATAQSLDDFFSLHKEFANWGEAVVFGPEFVSAQLDSDRPEEGQIIWRLPLFPLLAELTPLRGKWVALDQRALVRNLRTTWRPFVNDAPQVEAYFQTISWEARRQSETTSVKGLSTVAAGSSSFEAKGTSRLGSGLLEVFSVRCNYWDLACGVLCEVTLPILVELEPDGAGGGQVLLTIRESDWTTAERLAREVLRERLQRRAEEIHAAGDEDDAEAPGEAIQIICGSLRITPQKLRQARDK